ncbi:hypothetical protein LK09_19525 [Microbacterium mangrovi]|uniref:Uncharacterized protein n=1 Tax=Microbacterium mangrovi TaxID=1348253 RepID=A0A0B2A130_9MICO|nr:hypothetical protein [Microbacterium mangrovi]KHK95285.1 hypothetical protein LK09_19525 [Microbacterium mangrovi]
MTEDELLELAELRRRAYGPDADIAADPEARARLAELEAASHARHPGASPVPPGPDAAGPHDPGRPAPVEASVPEDPVPRRRRTRIVGAAVTAGFLLVVAAVLWPRPPAPVVAKPNPTITFAAVDVTCGSGWGSLAAGTLTPPRPAYVVWSPMWNAASAGEPTMLVTDHGEWLGQLTPVFVPGGVAAVVQVIDSQDARIVTFARSRSEGDSFTTSDYADTNAMVAAARRIVPLPPCPDSDTYPLLVIAPDKTCVQLEVTLAEGPVYRARVPVGADACAGR